MKVGISTASLFLRIDTEDALALFADWGIGETEVFLNSYGEYGAKFARLLKSKRGGVNVNSVHVLGTQFEPQLFAEHPRVLRDAYGWLEKVIESANILGAKYYTFHGLARMKRTFRENLPSRAEKLRDVCDFCSARGVTLCLENVEWALYNRTGVFRELKKGCPSLLGVLDIKQARLSGEPYERYLEEMGEALAYVHVSDLDGNGKMCLPGCGTFDFDGLFSRLKQIGFRGDVLLENYGNDYREIGELKRAYEFLAKKAEKFS